MFANLLKSKQQLSFTSACIPSSNKGLIKSKMWAITYGWSGHLLISYILWFDRTCLASIHAYPKKYYTIVFFSIRYVLSVHFTDIRTPHTHTHTRPKIHKTIRESSCKYLLKQAEYYFIRFIITVITRAWMNFKYHFYVVCLSNIFYCRFYYTFFLRDLLSFNVVMGRHFALSSNGC